jgi:uncharacterized protein YcbK (DUF882 family)
MTPSEFDAACRELVRLEPHLSETSGHRTVARNEQAGGSEVSKHLLGMARDFAADEGHGLQAAETTAEELGLWAVVHDAGSGCHLHCQGMPVGPPQRWWSAKFNRGE